MKFVLLALIFVALARDFNETCAHEFCQLAIDGTTVSVDKQNDFKICVASLGGYTGITFNE